MTYEQDVVFYFCCVLCLEHDHRGRLAMVFARSVEAGRTYISISHAGEVTGLSLGVAPAGKDSQVRVAFLSDNEENHMVVAVED